MWSLLGATVGDWYANRAQRLGAALAYYTIFALAPGLIILIAVAGLLFGAEFSKVWKNRRASGFVPEHTTVPVTEEARAEHGLGPRPTS